MCAHTKPTTNDGMCLLKNMGGPIHRAAQLIFPFVNFPLVRATFRERVGILAQEVERGGFFR